ncbi:oligoendopeptidase F [Aneurinibacillus thermoaerophilus]|uniref:oligoendopeptidase F n=1 Tax=Aneurinibacillus thermoaerophilus TaxID=143495 RepID=UPI002E1BD369|nr:oligoendopeptidase F [Aneurinibacillus thermoaerophilus]MED0674292.1 oligoendopeptidase F [Aneurinibacillus thermoaerophilus]
MRKKLLIPFAGMAVGVWLIVGSGGLGVPTFRTAERATPPTLHERPAIADTWDLTRLYASSDAWQKDIQSIVREAALIASYKGKLDHAHHLYEALSKQEEASRKLEKAYVYAQLQFDTHTTDSIAQQRLHEARRTAQKLTLATSFIGPELARLDDKKLERMYHAEKKLVKYRRYISELRKERGHILSEKEEKLLALTGEAMGTAAQAYRFLLDTDLAFPSIKDEKGKSVPLTRERYVSFMTSPKQAVRRRAFEAVYGTYAQYGNTFASLLAGEVRRNVVYAQARRYPSARYAALHASDIPESIYDQLISTVRHRIHLLHRYTALRKKMLGLSALHKYDLYVPFIRGKKREYTLSEAKTMVREGLAPLGAEYQQKLEEAFRNRWMDVYSRKGKTGGAYQTAVYGYPPYVLLNYNGRLDDVLTMAHEMGHAMHSYYANKTQNYLNANYDIFVAEVASTVNESLLLRRWIEEAKDKKERAMLLNRYLDTFQGTLFAQTMFAEFERDIYQAAEKGEALTADDLVRRYRKLVAEYYGPALTLDPNVGYEWARVPHFYKNFYVYQYATGFSAATALADRLLHGGPEKREQYLAFLKAGGSAPPLDVLRKAGVDLRNPEVISRALDVFEQALNELEKLAQEV